MKVFVAGATGVLGRELVPQLVARGHEVVGMTRSPSKRDLVRSLGARPVVADALDPDAVAQAVASAEPEVIVHQLTALSGPMSIRDAAQVDALTEAAYARFGDIDSVKAVSELFAPLTGEVVEVNARLADAPELVNQDPYAGGWMVKLRPADRAEFDGLLSAEQYEELLKNS